MSWTDKNSLLERVEFLSEAQPLALFRRFRDHWTLWDTSQARASERMMLPCSVQAINPERRTASRLRAMMNG